MVAHSQDRSSSNRSIPSTHATTYLVLGVTGPVLAAGGLVLVAIGAESFLAAVGSFESPEHFWCLLIGVPLVVAGHAIVKCVYWPDASCTLAADFTAADSRDGVRRPHAVATTTATSRAAGRHWPK